MARLSGSWQRKGGSKVIRQKERRERRSPGDEISTGNNKCQVSLRLSRNQRQNHRLTCAAAMLWKETLRIADRLPLNVDLRFDWEERLRLSLNAAKKSVGTSLTDDWGRLWPCNNSNADVLYGINWVNEGEGYCQEQRQRVGLLWRNSQC